MYVINYNCWTKANVKLLLIATREIKVRQKSMKAIKQPYGIV